MKQKMDKTLNPLVTLSSTLAQLKLAVRQVLPRLEELGIVEAFGLRPINWLLIQQLSPSRTNDARSDRALG